MPILPNGVKPEAPASPTPSTSAPSGGSPRGWTFISTGLNCWYRWSMRYLFGLHPLKVLEYFDLGSAFHAFMEGQPEAQILADYPAQFETAKALARVRMDSNVPLGAAEEIEIVRKVFGGLMTSKPDRVEANLIRDYKTAMQFSENDDEKWGVDGGIVGEMIAAEKPKALVDITRKRDDAKSSNIKMVTVKLTQAKHDALKQMVNDFWDQLGEKLKTLDAEKIPTRETLLKAFGRHMPACVDKYGVCPYYARCWGEPPESMLYRKSNADLRWVDGPKGPSKKTVVSAQRFAKFV